MKHDQLRRYTNSSLTGYTHRELKDKNVLIFVFNRTSADVERVAELNRKYLSGSVTAAEAAEWMNGMKGALNVDDLNRNEENIKLIAGEILLAVKVKRWKRYDVPGVSDYARIAANVKSIREGYGVMADTPQVPEQPLNTYRKWNDIEKILYDVHNIYIRVQADRAYCGSEMHAGEGVGLV